MSQLHVDHARHWQTNFQKKFKTVIKNLIFIRLILINKMLNNY